MVVTVITHREHRVWLHYSYLCHINQPKIDQFSFEFTSAVAAVNE